MYLLELTRARWAVDAGGWIASHKVKLQVSNIAIVEFDPDKNVTCVHTSAGSITVIETVEEVENGIMRFSK